eukprot:TCALIF_13406-PA protein Name:"Protein of unknown function" AED:0.39 eAED:0.39 QI:0/0/0/0.5/1/1/2/0/59
MSEGGIFINEEAVAVPEEVEIDETLIAKAKYNRTLATSKVDFWWGREEDGSLLHDRSAE